MWGWRVGGADAGEVRCCGLLREDGSGWRVCLQEAAIVQGQASRAVDLYPVLIMAGGLYYSA